MPRKWETDGDDALVTPSGCVRCGYDADTQSYTYRHPNGDLYEGAPGATYGPLRLVSRRVSTQNTDTQSQPPAYPPRGSSPPPYSPSRQNSTRTNQGQGNGSSPAVTFDEIFRRHLTDINVSCDGQTAGGSKTGRPKRSTSLRSVFGSRREGVNNGKGSPSRVLSRRATMGETQMSYKE